MIVAGIGYRAAATLADLQDALALTGTMPDALASIAAKAHCVQMTQLANDLNLPVIALMPDQICGVVTPTQSDRINARFGTGCLCEAAALAGAQHNSSNTQTRILVTRVLTANGMATAAIAERIPL